MGLPRGDMLDEPLSVIDFEASVGLALTLKRAMLRANEGPAADVEAGGDSGENLGASLGRDVPAQSALSHHR